MAVRLTCTTFLFFLLSACASTSPEEDSGQSPVVVVPTAAVFEPTDALEDFRDVVTEFKSEQLQTQKKLDRSVFIALKHKSLAARQGLEDYNQYMVRPTGGTTPLIVDCATTEYIGFLFIAGRRAGKASVSRFTLTYEWTNAQLSGPAGSKSRVLTSMDGSGVIDFVQERIRPMYSAWLGLSDDRRVDGIWNLSISHRGQEVHREVFHVRGCEASTQPAADTRSTD